MVVLYFKLILSHFRASLLLTVYVVVGNYFEHLGLLLSLLEKGLLHNGQYFVVGVDVEQYDRSDPERYFKGFYTNTFSDMVLKYVFLT